MSDVQPEDAEIPHNPPLLLPAATPGMVPKCCSAHLPQPEQQSGGYAVHLGCACWAA